MAIGYLCAFNLTILIHQKIGEKSRAALEMGIEMRLDFVNGSISHLFRAKPNRLPIIVFEQSRVGFAW